MTAPRLLPVGEAALSVELGDAIDPALSARVRGLDHALLAERPAWLRETVPSYRSLLVVFDPLAVAREEVLARLHALAGSTEERPLAGAVHEVPVLYQGEDLPEVARHCRLSEAEVVARHTSGEYTAFMLGFMPGFAYLGLLPAELETPRRATPRLRVPPGSVAIAGRQTAVYPFASPGGWNLIGSTTLSFFDAQADPPARIRPGDRVRFHAVDELPPPRPAPAEAAVPASPAVEVLAPGLLTTVQDGGRFGWRRLGVGWAGAMDARALYAANQAVGNAAAAAALECTIEGPVLRFLRSVRVALAGADLGAVLERADLGAWPVPSGTAVLARPGNVLRLTARRSGCRAYLAFAGGIDVPAVLGSYATDLPAGFGGLGGRPLRSGDRLALANARAAERPPTAAADIAGARRELRVVLGPQRAAFDEATVRVFLDGRWEVLPASDRAGCRLHGPRLFPQASCDIVTDAMLPGSIQVPPDGQPIIMAADAPTTGGYAKIATVIGADIPALGQLMPGEAVRLRAVTVEQARRALEER